MSDRVAIMRGGLIEQVGTPRDVYQRPATVFVADFVGVVQPAPRAHHVVVEADRALRRRRPGLGTIPSAGVPGLAEGQPVALIVRPESVLIAPEGAAGDRGRRSVLDVAFMGPHVPASSRRPTACR